MTPAERNIGLVLTVAAYVLSFFHRVAPAAIASDLQASFAISGTQLGHLAAAYFYIYTLMQLPTGVLVDTLGPRRMLFWGGLTAGMGALLFGLAASFSGAFAGRILVGLGVSVTFIALLKLIALGYEERRFATLVGVSMFIGNMGSILAGAPLAWAAQTFGWRAVFVSVGLLSLLLALASLRWVMDSNVRRVNRSLWMTSLKQVLTNRATWPGFFVCAGLAGSFFAFAGLWATPFLTQVHGMSRTLASNHISIYFLGFAVGCLTWGRLSDHLGRRKPVMMAAATLNVVGWLTWLIIPPMALNATTTYALCAFMGLTSAAFTLTWAAAKEVNPPHLSGIATSIVNIGVFLGAACLQPLTGAVIEYHWKGHMIEGVRIYSVADYAHGLQLLALAALCGTIATWFLKETHCRNIYPTTPS